MERASIVKNKLVIVTSGGSLIGLGISGFRCCIKQIEASKLKLKESTKERLAVMKRGVVIWDAR